MAERQNTDLILKILSGPHLGAEVGLTEGVLTIGHEADSDLILNDQTAAPHHAALRLAEGQCVISPLEGEVKVGGEPIEGDRKVGNFEVITLGTTNLAIGPAGERWPEILLPVASGAAATPAKDAAPPDADPASPAADAAEAKETLAPETQPAAGEKPPRKSGGGARVWLAGGAMVLLSLAVAAFVFRPDLFQQQEEQPQSVYTSEGHLESVRAAIAKMGLSNQLRAELVPGGGVNVSGYVNRLGDRRMVEDELARIPGEESVRIWSTVRIENGVQTALTAQGFDVIAKVVGDGVVLLEGVVEDSSRFQGALNKVRQSVGGIKSFDDRTVREVALEDHLYDLLRKHGISDQLKLSFKGDSVVATGEISEADREKWEKTLREFETQHGAVLRFHDDTRTLPTANVDLDLEIKGVRVGESGYIITNDGVRYGVGATLPNGATIQGIEKKNITLVKDGKVFVEGIPSSVKWIMENDDG